MLLTKLQTALATLLVFVAFIGGAGLIYQTQAAQDTTSKETQGRTAKQADDAAAHNGDETAERKRCIVDLERQIQVLTNELKGLQTTQETCRPVPKDDKTQTMGGTVPSADNRKYKGSFISVLRVVAEHFEEITYANQYEGRIEARAVDAKPTGIIREASVRFLPDDGGGLSIFVTVKKVRTVGDKSEVVGRDADLEQVITAEMDEQKVQMDGSAHPPALMNK